MESNLFDLLNEYQMFTRTTAQYPEDMALAYTRLGFVGELGEIANKYKKVIRGDYTFETIKEDLVKELGDALWYLARYADALDYRLSWVFRKIEGRTYISFSSHSNIPNYIEDINKNFSDIVYTANESLLQWVGYRFAELCNDAGTDLLTVLQLNQKKLQDRLERNVIKGSGDNR